MLAIYNSKLVLILFISTSSAVLFEETIPLDYIYQSFCVAGDNVTISSRLPSFANNLKRIPGEISKRKCINYLMCSPTGSLRGAKNYPGLGWHPGFPSFISGGIHSLENEFPHMALVGYEYKSSKIWNCGGSLISENFVLTAAHCMHDSVPDSVKVVRLGITHIKDTSHLQEIYVKELIRHPEYKRKWCYHDIGLLRLSTPVQLNDYIKPACVHLDEDMEKYQPMVTGWGEIYKDYGKNSDRLLKADLEFFDVKRCNKVYKRDIKERSSKLKHGVIPKLMICAGSTTSKKDTCAGDSGGPLQVYENGMYFIVGITSYGKPCGLKNNRPGIYTKVSSYLQWIEDHVWPE